ncbi:phospholipid carrier-dependent glycosyltransferase [Leucobacter tardus]|uniref:dolichyl-phosphate-mannose--protein mannosyltransferase n=1 Tax=Leucobacter tardus TaxID=501483 RepID=UPI0027DE556F|nr:phospholipid carrier-dependent glycosyltransferase [Leucobacter tardus]
MTVVSTLLRRRWLGPVAVLAVALILRFWALGRPDTLVFDEVYYVRDAISQLAHGYPTVWPDREPSLAGGRATEFSESAANAVHPPLGKWLIGLGILIFGADTGWGWRSAVALAGVLTVALTMRLAWSMSRSLVTTCLAGLLLAIDGVHVTLSRVGLLDGLLACAIVGGALCLWHDHLRDRTRSWWMRPWLIGGAACFGAASAIKWSGIYPLVFFFVFIAVSDVLVSRRTGSRRPWLGAAARTFVTGIGALIVALTTYVASWTGWILTSGGHARDSASSWWGALWRYHVEMLEWHRTLSAPHPYDSSPWTWPLGLVPTAMHRSSVPAPGAEPGSDAADWVSVVSPLPNLLVTWGGLLALVILVIAVGMAVTRAARRRGGGLVANPLVGAAAFIVVAYLSGWLPWVLTVSRSAVFQFYAVVLTPFAALALALVLAELVRAPDAAGHRLFRFADDRGALLGRRIAVGIFACVAVAVSCFFFPLWTGMPVSTAFWHLHLWLPDWV